MTDTAPIIPNHVIQLVRHADGCRTCSTCGLDVAWVEATASHVHLAPHAVPSEPSDVEYRRPVVEGSLEHQLRELVLTYGGTASVCWENPGGAGVFQSEMAEKFGIETVDKILALLEQRDADVVEEPAEDRAETLHEQRERITTEHGERQRLIDLGLLPDPNQRNDYAMAADYQPQSELPHEIFRLLVESDRYLLLAHQRCQSQSQEINQLRGRLEKAQHLLRHLRDTGCMEFAGSVTFQSLDYRNLVDMIDYALGSE